MGGVGPPCHPIGIGVDDKQPDPVAVGELRADYQQTRAVAVRHRVLGAGEHPRTASPHSLCGDLNGWPTAARFGVRERQQGRSLRHPR